MWAVGSRELDPVDLAEPAVVAVDMNADPVELDLGDGLRLDVRGDVVPAWHD